MAAPRDDSHSIAPSISWPAAGAAALIFDCDGTLADTMAIHFVAWTSMLREHGIAFGELQFYELAGMPTRMIIRQLAAEQGVDPDVLDVDAMVTDKESRYVGLLSDVQPVQAVFAIAQRYRGVLPMAVASGGERWVVERTLRALGCFEWFDAIVCADDTERHKPEPDVFLEAARKLGVVNADCVVFEDSDLGLEAARRAGMRGVDIRRWS